MEGSAVEERRTKWGAGDGIDVAYAKLMLGTIWIMCAVISESSI